MRNQKNWWVGENNRRKQEATIYRDIEEEWIYDASLRPRKVEQAIKYMWIVIGFSSVLGVIATWTGAMKSEILLYYMIVNGFFCIAPYKIGNGSNATRYIYTILVIGNYLLSIGQLRIGAVDIIEGIGHIAIIKNLFSKEANIWFENKKKN